MKIIVYGLGRNGRRFIHNIWELYHDIEIAAVTDSYVQEPELPAEIRGLYKKASCIGECIYDYVIVTAEKYFDEISNRLTAMGVDRERIQSAAAFGQMAGRFHCSLCGNRVFAWNDIGEDHSIFHHKDIVGASRRKGGCPICRSSDRERYVFYILKNHTDILKSVEPGILHFAPESMLSKKLRRKGYISADILPGRADVAADITDMPFHDGQFDYIICSHVMEHVSKEREAFWEIRRCLKPDGMLVFTVPVCWEEDTFEDACVGTEEERTRYYGQKDHVRLYGKDIVERIEAFGFSVDLYRSDQELPETDVREMGLIWKDSVLLCRNRNADKGS